MEQSHSVGLYLARDRAVAVRLSEKEPGTISAVLAIQPDEEMSAQTMALEAAGAIRREGTVVEHLFVALDGGYYTQYNLHSEFSDPRQVESTIKFDVEEAAATDAMNLAVTFMITGPLPTGSEVTAFAADRQSVTDILLDIHEGGLDPEMIEPDAVCLARVLEHTLEISKHPDTLYVLVTESSGYFIQPGHEGYAPKTRSFLLQPDHYRTAALTREILLTMAATDSESPLKKVVFVDTPQGVDQQALAQRTGLEVGVESALTKFHCRMPFDHALSGGAVLMAVGAAMAPVERRGSADFRRDFMPYQGKRKMMESSLRLAGISLAVLLASIAIYFQSRTWRMTAYAETLHTKLADEYRAAMYGSNPPTTEAITSRLRRTLNNVRRVQEGLGPGDDKSVPAKLTFLLEAINNAPPSVDVVIQQINISERTMRVKGDTNSRRATLDLFEAIKKHPRLRFGQERMSMAGNRDNFEFTVEPAQ